MNVNITVLKKNEVDIYELRWKETLSGKSEIQIDLPLQELPGGSYADALFLPDT